MEHRFISRVSYSHTIYIFHTTGEAADVQPTSEARDIQALSVVCKEAGNDAINLVAELQKENNKLKRELAVLREALGSGSSADQAGNLLSNCVPSVVWQFYEKDDHELTRELTDSQWERLIYDSKSIFSWDWWDEWVTGFVEQFEEEEAEVVET